LANYSCGLVLGKFYHCVYLFEMTAMFALNSQ